jgi:hypothetical protein
MFDNLAEDELRDKAFVACARRSSQAVISVTAFNQDSEGWC